MHVVSLHKVIEVREGQRTDMFDKFSFEQAESQSFSLIYQQEGGDFIIVIGKKKLCSSLDITISRHLISQR